MSTAPSSREILDALQVIAKDRRNSTAFDRRLVVMYRVQEDKRTRVVSGGLATTDGTMLTITATQTVRGLFRKTVEDVQVSIERYDPPDVETHRLVERITHPDGPMRLDDRPKCSDDATRLLNAVVEVAAAIQTQSEALPRILDRTVRAARWVGRVRAVSTSEDLLAPATHFG